MTTDHALPPNFQRVLEIPADHLPALVHPVWLERFPWVVQGTTSRGPAEEPFDLGLFSSGSTEQAVRRHWDRLLRHTSAARAVHSQQVHGSIVRVHHSDDSQGPVLQLVDACDGHATACPDALLAVTVADCVPVFIVDERHRAVAAIHAGWRGAAAGVLEQGLEAMGGAFGTVAAEVYLHFGPSICGGCYEVGPEVFDALCQPVPSGPAPIDLRVVLAGRATDAGVGVDRISISEHCTRCTESGLFSHRAGDLQRQVGYMGVRA